MTPYINEDQEWKDMIEPSVMESVREEDGKDLSGSVSTAAFACSGVFWNRELFERQESTRFPETWEEFWKCCEKLKAARDHAACPAYGRDGMGCNAACNSRSSRK